MITDELTGVRLMDLRPGEEVAGELLAAATAFYDDPEWNARFYTAGVVRTELRFADDIGASQVLIKPEIAQDSGSYKRRGATAAVLLSDAGTVVTYSTGNHGLAVLKAGTSLGRKVEVYVPESISSAKERPLLAADAQLQYFPTFAEAQAAAAARRCEAGVRVIDPFGHPDVVLGQLSVGLELVDDLVNHGLADSNVTIPVPVAGAGLITGVAVPVWAAKQAGVLGPNIQVVGVQPGGTDAAARAIEKLRAGRDAVQLFPAGEFNTDCDALAITEASLSALTLSVLIDPQFVRSMHRIDKLELARARQYTSFQIGTQVEPAAALPTAYALAHHGEAEAFVLPVTGKNVSWATRHIYDDLVARADSAQYREISRAALLAPLKATSTGEAEFARGAVLRGPVVHR